MGSGGAPSQGQRGFTLLQLMMTVAVLGILAALTARLLGQVLTTWVTERAGFDMHQNSRQARDLLVTSMRNASISSVVITRADVDEPPLSKVCYVDSRGDSHTVYQQGRRLYFGAYGSSTATVTTSRAILGDYVERFNVYYPDLKDPSHVAFSLMLRATPLKMSGKHIELLTTGDIEMKAP